LLRAVANRSVIDGCCINNGAVIDDIVLTRGTGWYFIQCGVIVSCINGADDGRICVMRTAVNFGMAVLMLRTSNAVVWCYC
jgi:hypothetical protein